jgi:hypothetical protein
MHHRVIAYGLLVLGTFQTLLAQERLDCMQVGTAMYSNVYVLSKTPADLFFTHSLGLSNVKVKDLDEKLKVTFGYGAEDDGGEFDIAENFEMEPLEVDSRVQAVQDKIENYVTGKLRSTPRNILLGIIGGMALIYLFFCYCCMNLCEKAGAPSPFLVWIPGLQLVPLFKAAGLPRWTVSALFAPQVFLGSTRYTLPEDLSLQSPNMMTFLALGVASILISLATALIWAIKICRVRRKSSWLALGLLFPPTTIFVFIYLALSNEEQVRMGNPGFVSFS